MEHMEKGKAMNMANVRKALNSGSSDNDNDQGPTGPADGSLTFPKSYATAERAVNNLKRAYKSIINSSTDLIDEMNGNLAWQLGGSFSGDDTHLSKTESYLKDGYSIMGDIHAISEETEQMLKNMLEYSSKMRVVCEKLQKASMRREGDAESWSFEGFDDDDDDE